MPYPESTVAMNVSTNVLTSVSTNDSTNDSTNTRKKSVEIDEDEPQQPESLSIPQQSRRKSMQLYGKVLIDV